MANLSINLLPQELTAAKQQRQKSTLVVQICVISLVIIIVMAGIVLSFRFAQTAQIGKVQSQITTARQQINTPENSQREGLVMTLRNRLDSLNKINTQSYPAAYAFALITKILPADTFITGFQIDKKGKVQLQVESPTTSSVRQLLDNLLDPAQNENKITLASVDGISLGKGNTYETSLLLTLTGGVK